MKDQTGKKPVAAPTAAVPAILSAIALIVGGVVLGREALLVFGAIDGSEWIAPALRWLDGLTAQGWMLPAGIAALVVGLILILTAVRPRRKTHRPLDTADVWVRSADIAEIARAAALDTSGVDTAQAKASKRKVTISVTSASREGASELKASVAESVRSSIGPLESAPKVRTAVRTRGAAS